MILSSSPTEIHIIQGKSIAVKREDLSAPSPGPPFSKVRGLVAKLEKLKEAGIQCVGYTETSISMAGWGVAWACLEMGIKCVIFDPQYKRTPGLLKWHRRQWRKFGAETIPIKAGMAKVNWYVSKNILREKYPGAVLLPLGLPFEETIEATAQETAELKDKYSTIVVCVGSGTVAAGIIRGLPGVDIIGVMCRTGSIPLKRKAILSKAQVLQDGLFGKKSRFTLIDEKWEYTDPCFVPCPFPCHPFYDRKAWKWLTENLEALREPILFWNIGSIIRKGETHHGLLGIEKTSKKTGSSPERPFPPADQNGNKGEREKEQLSPVPYKRSRVEKIGTAVERRRGQ